MVADEGQNADDAIRHGGKQPSGSLSRQAQSLVRGASRASWYLWTVRRIGLAEEETRPPKPEPETDGRKAVGTRGGLPGV